MAGKWNTRTFSPAGIAGLRPPRQVGRQRQQHGHLKMLYVYNFCRSHANEYIPILCFQATAWVLQRALGNLKINTIFSQRCLLTIGFSFLKVSRFSSFPFDHETWNENDTQTIGTGCSDGRTGQGPCAELIKSRGQGFILSYGSFRK